MTPDCSRPAQLCILLIPGGERALEPIRVVALVDDTVSVHAELVCRSNSRNAVDADCRRRVNVEDLWLTRVGSEASLTIVLSLQCEVNKTLKPYEWTHTWKKL